MSRTITELTIDANTLYDALTAGLNIDLNLPEVTLPTDFPLPPETGAAYDPLTPITVDQLTEATVEGSGVFDVLMRAVSTHLAEQHKLNRITGADYAKVYLGSVTSVLQFGTQFLLSKDQSMLQNLQMQEQVKLAALQRVRAQADVALARGQIVQLGYENAKIKLDANTSANQYAISKVGLVTAFDQGLINEANILLTKEQVEVQRAQTRDTHIDGTPIIGILGKQKELIDTQIQTQLEELDTARSSTKDTLLSGGPVAGLVAIDKAFKEAQQLEMENRGLLTLQQAEGARAQVADTLRDNITPVAGILAEEKLLKQAQANLTKEQYEAARAQTRDTLSNGAAITGLVGVEKLIKLAQKLLTEEQVDTQRAQTKETLVAGGPIIGIAQQERLLKTAQAKYINEQYESQRGQTRNTLSTGETVVGILGIQKALYEEQITSYKRDAESKTVKMLLDTWTARKTIDDATPLPIALDTASIDSAVSSLRSRLPL